MNYISYLILRLARFQWDSRRIFGYLRQYSSQLPIAAIVDTVGSTIAENFGGAAYILVSKEHLFLLGEVPDVSSKVVTVTGGSRGIGYGCTYMLHSHNAAKTFHYLPFLRRA